MKKIEELQTARNDGLDAGKEIETFTQQGWKATPKRNITRLKWHGSFRKKHTPGVFMMRISIPNGIASIDHRLLVLGDLVDVFLFGAVTSRASPIAVNRYSTEVDDTP